MADAKVLVRHSSGHPAGIAAGDTATAPSFKASTAGGTALDANNGKVINLLAGTATTDGVNKQQMDAGDAGRVPNARLVNAGQGLTGGGNLGADITLNIALAANSGLVLAADSIGVDFGVGTNQVPRGDHGHATLVPTARKINAGQGLAGGGDLSADRTIDLTLDGTTLSKSVTGLKANIGTAAGTVAAGDHGHATLVPNTRAVNTGQGLTGGGALSADRTIDLVLDGGTLSKTAAGLKANVGTAAGTLAAGDHAHGNLVPTARTVSAGDGLTGGGALSANITLAVRGDGTKGVAVNAAAGVQIKLGKGLAFDGAGNVAIRPPTPNQVIQFDGFGDEEFALNTSGQSLNQVDGVLKVHGLEFVPGQDHVLIAGQPVAVTAAKLNTLIEGENADALHNHSTSPLVHAFAIAGEALATGDAVCIDPADGKAYKANNTAARAGFVGFARAATPLNQSATLLQVGAISIAPLSALAAGQYWLGPTAGVLVNAPPASGRQVRVGFKALSSSFLVACQDFGEV